MHTSGTDEKLEKPVKRGHDLDTVMLFGCSSFVVVSLVNWALVVWPFFLFQDTFVLKTLELCLAIGLAPATVMGAVTTRIYGLPAAAGFLAGSVCSGVFLYLRIQQVMAFVGVPDAPQPDYPASWGWMIPVAWVLLTLIVIAVFMKPSEYAIDGKEQSGS